MTAPPSLTATVLVGAVAGALFGVAFGMLSSVFDGGPTAAQGVSESWGWFCVLGMALAFGFARARRADARRPASGSR